MNFSLPKIKLPFKKLKWVCTTDLILDTKTGKSIAANNDDSLFFIRFQNKTVEQITSSTTREFLYFIEAGIVDSLVQSIGLFKVISKAGASILLTPGDEGIWGTFTFKFADGTITTSASLEIDQETGEYRVVVGDVNVDTDNDLFEMIGFGEIGPIIRETLEHTGNSKPDTFEWMINSLREGVDITISE